MRAKKPFTLSISRPWQSLPFLTPISGKRSPKNASWPLCKGQSLPMSKAAWRSGRVVEGDGLENRSALTSAKGSNPFSSSTMGTLGGFPNPPALWLRRAKPAYAYAI